MHCATIYQESVCDVTTLKMDALSEQLNHAPFFAEDTDVNYLHCCDLNDQFDVTVPSLPFVRLNVVFDHFSSLVERSFPIKRERLGYSGNHYIWFTI